MKQKEFLAMVAFENACSLNSCDSKDYGFDTWADAYDELNECEETSFLKDGAVETFWLTEEMSYAFTLGAALVKSYNEAALVLRLAKAHGVEYETSRT